MVRRVLIYSHTFAPRIGGAETIVMTLATGLANLNKVDGTTVEVGLATATAGRGFDDRSLPFRVVRQPSMWQLARLIRAADVVHLAGPAFLPLLVGLLFRKPVVVEHHGFQTICPNGQLLYEPTQKPCPGHFMAGRYGNCIQCNARTGIARSLNRLLVTFPRRWLSARARLNITPTNWLSTQLNLPRMTTIYHGLSADGDGRPSAIRSSLPKIVFLGRLVSTKGVDILLRAANRLKKKGVAFTLDIVGDGPQRAQLEANAQVLGLKAQVRFLGHQPAEELPKVLSCARAIVIPSIGGEVFGLVAAESMARGILPIVSDGGALAEVVGNTGLRFPPEDEEALACCLERVLQSPDFAVREGRRAQERALRLFSQKGMITRHVALYREVLGEASAAPVLVGEKG